MQLQRLLDRIVMVEKTIAFLTFVAMVLALGADVAGRELFNHGVFGSVKFAVYALIFCAMAGFGIATSTGSHLRPKFLDHLFRGALESPSIRLGQLVSAAILLSLAYAGLQMVQFSILIEDRDLTLDWPVWPIQMAIPVGFTLSALRHLIYAVKLDLLPVEQGAMD